MEPQIKKKIHDFMKTYHDYSQNLTNDDRFKNDFYHYNLTLCITASIMLCVISLIGLIGTYAPFSHGEIIPYINATAVYIIIFTINIVFFVLMSNELLHHRETLDKKTARLLDLFIGINMVLASLTFYTTQKGSSFFFEYILMTIIIYLVPNVGLRSYIRDMFINIITMCLFLFAAQHYVAWQDIVDLVALQIICFFVNYARLASFMRMEKNKLSTESEKDQFFHDSRTDGLTGLYNRMALRDDFNGYFDHDLCVALIDLDFFKNSNDTYGHEYGDQVLETTAQCMKQAFHDDCDNCYRYGGDEFLVVSKDEEDSFVEKIKTFSKLCSEDQNVEIHCSIGYSNGTPHDEAELRALFKSADHYLYQAKEEGIGYIKGGHLISTNEKHEKETPFIQEDIRSESSPSLPNLRKFLMAMDEARQKESAETGELVVLYFDLIKFRMINLNFGIAAADRLLNQMGEELSSFFHGEVVAHLDADHFAVLTTTNALEERTADAREIVRKIFPMNIECSIGACIWSDHELGADTILNQAKMASDENRKHVGTYFSYYNKELGDSLETAEYVVSYIDEAITNGWIVVYYQPIVRTLSNKICGMEALARWQDPENGMLAPYKFIGPLEEAHLIWKLDLCVIKQVVMAIAERYKQGLPEIPVSINLSRYDFIYCDIFNEIEKLVKTYDVPRRMLHIEVTESVLTAKESDVLNVLKAFRDVGYEIWMDDFGSGYSTLNLLKDYFFDLLKMDMVFLRSDSKRSREIIASVIEMDKKISICTLAEGVETKEQVEFLKKSGCEKMQGYYFGKPLPFDETLQNCTNRGLGIESAKEKICYDGLGSVNFMTDIPLAIVEYHQNAYHFLFVNDPLLHIIEKSGFADPTQLEKLISDSNNVVSRELLKVGKYATESGNEGKVTVPFHNRERLLRYRLIGKYNERSLFAVKVFERAMEAQKLTWENQLLMNLTYFYRYIFTINPKKMTIRSIRFMETSATQSTAQTIRDQKGNYTTLLPAIFVADAKRYEAFIDPKTLKTRLEQNEYGILSDIFRTQNDQGTYVWMSHRILLVPNANQIIYVIRTMDHEAVKSKTMADSRDLSVESRSDLSEVYNKARLFDNLMLDIPLPIFWKDTNRRFLGASQYFLNYYGFSSVDDILGKTDEDMGWHPNNEVYQSDEEEILKSRMIHLNVPGRCIVKGESREILATKWPTYKDGRVSGLMGFFLENKFMLQDMKTSGHIKDEEQVMNLKSASQFVDDLIDYETDYQLNRVQFGILYIWIPEVKRISDNYGREVMNKILLACMKVIAQAIGNTGSAAYVGVGQFAVASSYVSTQTLLEKAKTIQEAIDVIREVDGVPCSLYAKVKVMYSDEAIAVHQEIVHKLFDNDEMNGRDHIDGRLSEINQTLVTVMDTMPMGCYILKPDHTILYWNRKAEELLGFTASEMQGRKCIDMPLGCSFLTGKGIPTSRCPAVVAYTSEESQSIQMFMQTKAGESLLIHNNLVPLKDVDGKVCELVAFFSPVVDEKNGPEFNKLLYESATMDSVTNLPGKKYMENCLEEALEIYKRTGKEFGLMIISIDHFYDLDTEVMSDFGQTIKKYSRKTDLMCRWSLEDFAILLRIRQRQDVKGAAHRFLRICKSSAIKEHIDDLSIGITIVREGDDLHTLINRVNQYVNDAKGREHENIVTDQNVDHQ